jgi:hypothetical protein
MKIFGRGGGGGGGNSLSKRRKSREVGFLISK